MEDQLNGPAPLPDKSARLRLFMELERARRLLSELRPERPAEHRRLWRLCLRTLRRPDVWIHSEENVTRRHANVYFGYMSQVRHSGQWFVQISGASCELLNVGITMFDFGLWWSLVTYLA